MSDVLDALRQEFEARDGSFLLQLRCDLHWDRVAFARLTSVMHDYVRIRERDADIPRWIAEGFWYLDGFVREWSQHPNFPRQYEAGYYDDAYQRLHDLAYFLFFGESPYEDPAALSRPI